MLPGSSVRLLPTLEATGYTYIWGPIRAIAIEYLPGSTYVLIITCIIPNDVVGKR